MGSINDLSWGETSFLAKLQLFYQSHRQEGRKIRSDNCSTQAQGYSALSSTYYSIVSTAFSQLKAILRPRLLAPVKLVLWCLTWFPLAIWCYWRMLPLSNKIVELVGYYGMSDSQCDVRQSILRHTGKHNEAKMCIEVALAKKPEKAHTRGLLRVGLAEIYQCRGDQQGAETELSLALAEVEEAEKEDPRQAVRIYRACAGVADFVGQSLKAKELRQKAQGLAQKTGASDQLLKL